MATGEEEVLVPSMVQREVQGLGKEARIPFRSGWERGVEGCWRVVRVIRKDNVVSANMPTCMRPMTNKVTKEIREGSRALAKRHAMSHRK